MKQTAQCAICGETRTFEAPDEYFSHRGRLVSTDCPFGGCIPRHRALAKVLFSIYPQDVVRGLAVHESSPGRTGVSPWLQANCADYVGSGYFPREAFGTQVGGLRNENLEDQTFENEFFDLVLHLDVLEHVFHPFKALAEIHRTLKPRGICLFTAPTYHDRTRSEQVAFLEGDDVRIVGEPEYHGNPQSNNGALVTWRYGYDFAERISAETYFDVEVRRWAAPSEAVTGPMTEVYILTKGMAI